MPVVNFIGTPETCPGKAGGDAGQAAGLSSTLSDSQGQQGRGRGSLPPAGPGLPRNSGGGSGAQASPRRPREGASLAASVRDPAPRGRQRQPKTHR